MRAPIVAIGQALMSYGEYTEDEDDVAWLQADVRRVLEAIEADESIEAALLDTAWTDPTWPGESERLAAVAAAIREAVRP